MTGKVWPSASWPSGLGRWELTELICLARLPPNQVIFSLVHLYLSHTIQPVTPPATSDPAQLRKVFLRVLQSNLKRQHEVDDASCLPEENLEDIIEEIDGALDVKGGAKGIEQLDKDDARAIAFRET